MRQRQWRISSSITITLFIRRCSAICNIRSSILSFKLTDGEVMCVHELNRNDLLLFGSRTKNEVRDEDGNGRELNRNDLLFFWFKDKE